MDSWSSATSPLIPIFQKLLAESARLKEAYPGGNAEHIAQQQVELADSWQELLNAIDDRRDELRAARDMHRYDSVLYLRIQGIDGLRATKRVSDSMPTCEISLPGPILRLSTCNQRCR